MTWRDVDGRYGLIICFCPTSVLPLLEGIAATMGYDLAVVWDFNAQ